MNTKTFILLSFIAGTSLALPAHAKTARTIEQCEQKFTDNLAFSQCLDTVKTLAERELTAWVNNKTFELEDLVSVTGRSGALNMFKKAQKNFETYRENNCKFYYLEISPGTGAASAYKKCYIKMTKARIAELDELS
ncbi:DUF1311 domain-containing protein [Thalassotalea sp. LPB0316]|uniref:lysozyme inhibitor LprI family protein n=1 Tax=Thalassotalea sp. LPB0316 TaxID=2769490 RepID=UPI001865E9F2|nr:lysozyme inhibitor LprI family protein [Thalassotalea sp. LPB0316]QOL24766.1 DUF1311 domain-containing protein [Thalassotalea sp. LPB0316]